MADPRARVLHTLLLGILAWIGFEILFIQPFFVARKSAALVLVVMLTLATTMSLVMLRRGSLRNAAIVYVLSTWSISTFYITLNGGIRSPALIVYAALPISAAWLFGYRTTILIAAACIATTSALALLATVGVEPNRYFPGSPFAYLAIVILTIIISAVPLAQVLRILQESLSQSKLANAAQAEELQKLMDVAPVALLVTRDPEAREVFGNRAGNALFESEEGANLSVMAPGGAFPAWRFFRAGVAIAPDELPMRVASAKGIEVRDWEAEVVMPSGTRKSIWGHASPLRDDTGRVRGAVAAFQDITARKRRRDALLRESEGRFTNMADAAPVMIWVSGPDKLCTFFNKGWLDFTGRSVEQELGKGWVEGVHPEDLDSCWQIYSSSFDARRSFQMEYRLRRMDGEYRWVLDNGIPRVDPAGEFAGFIGTCVDITDLKRQQHEDLAKQKRETVGMLAEGIAHDFNNVLGGILAYSELALAEVAEGTDHQNYLQNIRMAAMSGSDIARQLMIYAEQESEVLELVSLAAVVEDIVALLKVSVSKHVTLRTVLGENLPVVRANPSQLRQVAMNLITNASEAIGDRDGVISVAASEVTIDPDSSLATSERVAAGNYVQLQVTDTGQGMTPEVQAKLFDPRFTTKATGSHGHGLVVVKRIVERFHGIIRVSSALGRGSTFQILLPIEANPVQTVPSLVASSAQNALESQATILLVDDEKPLREAVSKMLRKRGLSVMEASDGSAALDMIRARKDAIDLLLLDITLPRASSRQVYDEAKRLKPGLPVIVTSGKGKDAAVALLATEVEHFIRKPFLTSALIDMIQRLLSSRAATRGARD
jgi:PAS domain S-box-containing protein